MFPCCILCSAWSLVGLSSIFWDRSCCSLSVSFLTVTNPRMSLFFILLFFGAGVSSSSFLLPTVILGPSSCSCVSSCSSPTVHSGIHLGVTPVWVLSPVFIFFAGGFPCWDFGLLDLFLLFLISLILASRLSSFVLASSISFSYFLYSLSPSLVLSLGKEHLLYSLLLFNILWWVFCWMRTDSKICRSKDVLVNLRTSIPYFMLLSCSPSCWSRACLSRWLDGLSCLMSAWCSWDLS